MRQPTRNPVKLPRHLLDEIGTHAEGQQHSSSRNGAGVRKARRKASRVQKKASVTSVRTPLQQRPHIKVRADVVEAGAKRSYDAAAPDPAKPLKSILKTPKIKAASNASSTSEDLRLPSLPPPPRPSKGVRDRLAADDAEIAALEKALGFRGAKALPKSFEEDGLDVLLEGLDHNSADDTNTNGKRRSEEDDWLQAKRRKAQRLNPVRAEDVQEEPLDAQITPDESEASAEESLQDVSEHSDDGSTDGESFEHFSEDEPSPEPLVKRIRENPYIAPATSSEAAATAKCIPPSSRDNGATASRTSSRLRRRTQGLLNRLSETNMLALLKDFEALYRDNPRQDVSSPLLSLLLDLLADPTSLQDTFVILHAGFIAALYRIIGSDFGAQAVSRAHDEFERLYRSKADADASSKKLTNLANVFAHLYNFKVIGSSLIYDLIRLFVGDLSETNTELLLRILRSSGSQLRKDDPGSLKAINQLLQASVAKLGSRNLSVRTSFMVETVSGLASRGLKTGIADSQVSAEHITRMKGILGSLNERNVKASEPLGISLKDLRETDKRGKWWLIGASFRDGENEFEGQNPSSKPAKSCDEETSKETIPSEVADFARLARTLGMNTDVRRSMFVTIMSADDYETAYKRLQKLPLTSSQKTEIPRVLIRCSSAQESYNPFFTLLARRLISAEPKLSKTFQFSLWSLFDRMREAEEGDEDEENNGLGNLELRSILNLGRLFGTLIAEDGLSLRILKDLNFAYLPIKLKQFTEVLLITVILQSQDQSSGRREEKALVDIFLKPKEIPDMSRGLQYFLKTVVGKTDIAGSQRDRETIKWGCKVVRDSLKAIASAVVSV